MDVEKAAGLMRVLSKYIYGANFREENPFKLLKPKIIGIEKKENLKILFDLSVDKKCFFGGVEDYWEALNWLNHKA